MTNETDLIKAAEEALEIAKGNKLAARLHHNGHAYVPKAELEAAHARIAELEGALRRIDEASNHYAMITTYSEGTLRYAHKSTRNLARAALEGKG